MKKILILLLIAFSTLSFAQKIKIVEGDLSALKGEKSLKTEFTYSPMSVGKFDDEKEYIAKRKAEMNEKEAGKGDRWESSWYADRKDRFEPQFRELFSKYSGLSTVDENAKYTLIFKTVATEPGFNIGIAKNPAFIDAEAWIVDSQNPDRVVAKLTLNNAPGRSGWDYETGVRIQEAYAKAGKELGAFIKNKTKK